MSKSKVVLPKWATLVQHAPSVGRDPVPIDQEEAYVRTRCYHEASRTIDQAVKKVLDQGAGDVTAAIQNSVTNNDGQPPPAKKTRMDGNIHEAPRNRGAPNDMASIFPLFALGPPQTFQSALLPVYLISGPPNPLDRLAWAKHLVDSAQRETKGAVVWLQGGPPTSWVTELIRQLLILEPLQQTIGFKGLSPIENLQLWCRSSQRFGFIQIYLDVQTIGSSAPPVNEFLNWLASVRSEERLPFSVVLLEASGMRRHDLCAYEQGDGAFLVKRLVLRPASALMRESLLWPSVSDLLTVLFTNNEDNDENMPLWSTFEATGSFVAAVLEWKKRLAEFLSSPGAFLLLDWHSLLSRERRRLEWMLSKEHVGLSQILNEPTYDVSRFREAAVVKRNMSVLSWRLRHIVAYDCKLAFQRDRLTKLQDHLPYLRLAAACRKERGLGGGTCSLLDATNEIIVVLDKCSNLGEILQCLDYHQRCWMQVMNTLPLKRPVESTFRPAQPRRDVSEGLLTPYNEAKGLSSVPGILFSALRNRVSITWSDLIEYFISDPICATLDPQEVIAYFSVGVNNLKAQGLIRERKAAGKNEAIFEKAAVVFCSGA